MSNNTTPGVYIREIATLPPSVAPVATAVPAFIGYTEKGPLNQAVRVSSLLEYEATFGGAKKYGITVNLVSGVMTASLSTVTANLKHNMYYSLQMYFANGGGPCWIVSVGSYTDTIDATDYTGATAGFNVISKIDEPTLLVFPDAANLAAATYGPIVISALAQCNTLQDRFVIADYVGADFGNTDLTAYRTAVGTSNLKYGAAYGPDLKTSLNYSYDETGVTLTGTGWQGTANSLDDLSAAGSSTNLDQYAKAKTAIAQLSVTLPPSGAIAGIYASVDRDRGVWKAPANVSLANVIAPTLFVTDADQGLMNVDATTGKSINAIRSFTGKGTLVWGARTLAGNDNEWRYVNVRRLFNFAEESIKKATEFSVFEPNDRNTWTRVRTTITNFLTNLWRDGALVGATPEQAFFVAVGLGETMTAQDILEGKMIVKIGIAASRPAEFIYLEFSHKLQEA
ncbi:MAG: phage tail sheath family protein [Bacteroidetes bacterium]|nr:phage tail sheath family protein [Bacteroidota bacterium]